MTASLLGVSVLLLGLIFFLSLVETSSTRLTRVALRVLAERDRDHRIALLDQVAQDRPQFLLTLQFAAQILTAGLAVVVTALLINSGLAYPLLWAVLIMGVLIAVFRQLVPRVLTLRDPERFLVRLLPVLAVGYRLLFWLSAPLLWLLRARRRLLPPLPRTEAEETSEEEIQAYVELGEEDGIIEEKETQLIQSALEFGSTLVREIMTPRSAIVAIQDKATVSELRDLIGTSKHSRIPVYRKTVEQIIGVAYVRNLLAYLEEGQTEVPITPLIKKAWFVPETKRVSELLREMQMNSEPMVIVVNEYGTVSGLVTIEDLIEEIVGEIYDEDESQPVELVAEGAGSYVVHGSLDIEELEKALDLDFGEAAVTTVSGLVVAHLGEVPAVGRRVEIGDIAVEILDADGKKIKRMRVRLRDAASTHEALDSLETVESESKRSA